MTAVPNALGFDDSPTSAGGEPRLPRVAFAFYLLVGAAAIAAAAPYVGKISQQRHGWLTFCFLAAGAALAQLFVFVTPRRGRNSEGTLSYHTTGVFLLPAALLLAPPLALLVPIVQPEDARARAHTGELADLRIVAVDDECRSVRECRDRGAPALGDELELAVAVELVAEEVAERHDAGVRSYERRG